MADFHARIATIEVSSDGGGTFFPIALARDATLNRNNDELDRTTRDNPRHRTWRLGYADTTIDISGLFDETDSGQTIMYDAADDGSEIDVRYRMRGLGTGNPERTAKMLVSSVSEGAPFEDNATFDATLRISGDPTAITQS